MSASRVFLLIFAFYSCDCKYGYVVWSGNKPVAKVSNYFADIPDVHVARATYSNEINSTGYVFSYLHFSEFVIILYLRTQRKYKLYSSIAF